MQYSYVTVALAALVASASAWSGNSSVAYTTEILTAYTTVCPAATELSFNGVTYTVSESTTLTITNCPCTVVKPVTTSSVVYCNTCAAATTAPVVPVYANTTAAATSTKAPAGTTPKASTSATLVPASGANKAFVASGAGLAGLIGLAAYIL